MVVTASFLFSLCCSLGPRDQCTTRSDHQTCKTLKVVSHSALQLQHQQHLGHHQQTTSGHSGILGSQWLETSRIASLLQKCSSPESLFEGKRIHQHIIDTELQHSRYLGNLLIHMYGKCGALEEAKKVFFNMRSRNIFSWNIMMHIYIQQGALGEAFMLFEQMPQRDVVSWNTMIAAFVQHGKLQEALDLFQQMPQRDVASWNAIITGYAQDGNISKALYLFKQMPKRNVVSWTAMVRGYAQSGQMKEAFELFRQMPFRNVVSWNVMISGFAQMGQVNYAWQLFQQMPYPDIISWTAMIAAYVQQRDLAKAFELFKQMPQRDEFTWSSMVAACAQQGQLRKASQLLQKMPKQDVVAWNAMITGYAEEGKLAKARHFFEQMPKRDVVSWNAMLAACCQHGHGEDVLKGFREMQLRGMVPNKITFAIVFSIYSHHGMVDDGCHQFVTMVQGHCIVPTLEHQNCMVDLLGRAGDLEVAAAFITCMPVNCNAESWISLLGSCIIYLAIEDGKAAAQHALCLNPANSAPYVLLSNLYASAGRNIQAAQVREMIRNHIGNVDMQMHIDDLLY